MAVGVCHLETVRRKEWLWDTEIGGGTYTLDNRGRTYSNWDTNINRMECAFEFFIYTAVYCY